MLSFKTFLKEHILSIGLSSKDDVYRTKHHDDLVNLFSSSYKNIGGYLGHSTGSESEYAALSDDIMNHNHAIKATKRNGEITAAVMYKKQSSNRKLIAAATNNSDQGKTDLKKHILSADNKLQRSWGEFSGPLMHVMHRLNFPTIEPEKVQPILNKQITINPDQTYNREIGGKLFTKRAMGHLK